VFIFILLLLLVSVLYLLLLLVLVLHSDRLTAADVKKVVDQYFEATELTWKK